ncbi:hypothetical protein ACFQZO_10195 [Bradyrhizobium sp. GCM10027634]|uniref:hypothetical protein n=1 Tax=unclassified Bradyrhizobium TaxID=2631580 RepID=UPI00263B7977|nr:hypothetical protein [Bradyrhizobium sp. WYCCWR 12677]MDN5001254.1 hypothetical protein [Bradyrhizobium sp. WYCCWR 12677]
MLLRRSLTRHGNVFLRHDHHLRNEWPSATRKLIEIANAAAVVLPRPGAGKHRRTGDGLDLSDDGAKEIAGIADCGATEQDFEDALCEDQAQRLDPGLTL